MDSETEDVALDEMVGNYVKLRDKIKAVDAAFKERTEKARQLLEEANLAILGLAAGASAATSRRRTAPPA